MVGGLTHQARLAHTRVTVTSLWIAMDTHTSTALFPFAQANTYRERLLIKGLLGEGWGGIYLFKAKSVPARGWTGARSCLQLTWACPAVPGQASEAGVGKDSRQAGRHERHVLGDRKPVTLRAAAMSSVYCVDIWRRVGSRPTRGDADLGLADTCS